jgi:hypothetical protein
MVSCKFSLKPIQSIEKKNSKLARQESPRLATWTSSAWALRRDFARDVSGLSSKHGVYPLVMTNIAIENGHL